MLRIPYELRIFFVIITSIFLIFCFSHFGVKAFEGAISNVKGFSEGTWIGPLNVSGLEMQDTTQQLIAKESTWKTNTKFQVTFKEVTQVLPSDAFSFLTDESIQNAKDGKKNQVLVNINDSILNSTLAAFSPTITEKDFDINRLKNDLIVRASELELGTINLNLGQYLVKDATKQHIIKIASLPIKTVDLLNIAVTFKVEPKSTFSLLSFLEKQGLAGLEPDSREVLASGIYQTILPTNFKIMERHIGTRLPENIPLGYEAKIDPNTKWDFSFYNPNEDDYKIQIYSKGQSLFVDLVGSPFIYKYLITENDFQEFAPKSIKQFSPLLNPNQSQITRKGKKGYYIVLYRVMKDKANQVIEQKVISKDYYSPIPQIEVFGLDSNEANHSEDSTNTDLISSNNESSSLENTSTTDEPEDLLWGKPDETEK